MNEMLRLVRATFIAGIGACLIAALPACPAQASDLHAAGQPPAQAGQVSANNLGWQ